MERCPLCKARLRDKSICSRCEADLGPLQSIESRAEQLAQQAVHSLLAGKAAAAARKATAAQNLHATTFHQALAGFIEKMHGEELLCQDPASLKPQNPDTQ